MFARLGIPEVCISDNGPPFDSKELRVFAKNYMFELNNSAPLMANSNGLVEKSVSIAKGILRKCDDPYIAMLEYRNSPLKHFGKSPNELMFNNKLMKSIVPTNVKLFKNKSPSTSNLLVDKFKNVRESQEKYYNRTAHSLPELSLSDSIRYKKRANSRAWDRAQLIKRLDERN